MRQTTSRSDHTPVEVLRELMGHRSMVTTQGYVRVRDERVRQAVQTLAPLQVDRHGNRTLANRGCRVKHRVRGLQRIELRGPRCSPVAVRIVGGEGAADRVGVKVGAAVDLAGRAPLDPDASASSRPTIPRRHLLLLGEWDRARVRTRLDAPPRAEGVSFDWRRWSSIQAAPTLRNARTDSDSSTIQPDEELAPYGV
jgi:hypothetical protein